MAILGLVSTESLTRDTYWEANFRRKVFYQYPNGALSIVGLLSLMKTEEVNSPEFKWWEDRFKRQVTTTASQGSSKGPFRLAADAVDGLDPFIPVADTEFMLYVAATEMFRVGHVVRIENVTCGAATDLVNVIGLVTAITSSTKMKVRMFSLPALAASPGFDNGATNENVGKQVMAIGTAFAQGVTNQTGQIYYLPTSFTNYTQIFRTPFSFTRNALMTPTKFDETGTYRDKAKKHSLYHMLEIEKAFWFGERDVYVKSGTVDETTGAGLPEYKTGGIITHFLQGWEAADSDYRGGTGAAAITTDSNDDKRIIVNAGGTVNEATWEDYMERIFRKTNNVTNERLCVCGNGYLKSIGRMFRGLGIAMYTVPKQDSFGMSIKQATTPFGDIYFKTHPLFSEDGTMRYTGAYLDIHNLKYRPFQKSDTFLRTGIQAPSMDGRMDEWLTEAGLEMQFPETALLHQNVQNYIP